MSNLSPNHFKARRAEAAKSLDKDSFLLLSSSKNLIRNNDTTFPFRQDSNFYYLTGFEEPESVLMLSSEGESTIFCRKKNPDLEKWDGYMYGIEGAKDILKFDNAYDIADIANIVPELIRGSKSIYSLVGKDNVFDNNIIGWITKANSLERHQGNIDLKNYSNALGYQRLIKGDEEVELMRNSCEIAAQAHKEVMKNVQVGMSEFDLESMYLNEFRKRGSRFPSYNPIVAGGKNACVLHYVDNNQAINDGELVLVDAGCEYGLYASDITRTYPINGKFSSEQKAIYDVVLEAHDQACEAATVGNSCLEPQRVSERVISQGLKDLGFLKESLDEILDKQLFREYYYHKIGHWIGLDVHDDCPYFLEGNEIKFEKNMAMTIEPGIYVNDSAPIDDKWKGIGIRIEDDILVTENGYENLTASVPSSADQIEDLMQS